MLDRHLTNRHLTNRHLTNRHLTNRHLTNRHFPDRHMTNRCLTNRILVSRQLIQQHLVYRPLVNWHTNKPFANNYLPGKKFGRPSHLVNIQLTDNSLLMLCVSTKCLSAKWLSAKLHGTGFFEFTKYIFSFLEQNNSMTKYDFIILFLTIGNTR